MCICIFTLVQCMLRSITKYSMINYTDMARHLVVDVHPMFRNSFQRVMEHSTPANVNVKLFKQSVQSLHYHHEGEDTHWFPNLIRKHPEIKDEVNILESDHQKLILLENRVIENDYESLCEFVSSLNDHLNREEMLTLPFLMDGSGGF